ncbi:hypothetical protein O9X80_07950 [Agrobacterium salinitolerans]|uniref:hypothetical protein n=1 Tax=Agrobacterium salinitolerans TaxID=1183413 RepID=UPI0022B8301E|nr:hypothetical protein [Agrobacterium salinitolerans]MCZ7974421.1 hypothetical protein [Agrobacterium salinitolerans]
MVTDEMVEKAIDKAVASLIDEHPMGHWRGDQVKEVARRAIAEAALSAAEPVSSRNDEAGYVEFLNEDVPYIVRDIQGAVAILTDLETRNVIGYRVYDPDGVYANRMFHAAPSVAVKALQMADETFRDLGWHDKYEATTAALTALSAQVQDVAGYQSRVAAAHHALFHDDPTDIAERNARSFEESVETAQAFGMSEDDAIALVKYTFSRPVGEPAKELGAKVLTAFSLGVVAGIDVMAAAEADLEKLQRPETIARIRAKRSTRHGRGPLPGFDPAAPAKQEGGTNE